MTSDQSQKSLESLFSARWVSGFCPPTCDRGRDFSLSFLPSSGHQRGRARPQPAGFVHRLEPPGVCGVLVSWCPGVLPLVSPSSCHVI